MNILNLFNAVKSGGFTYSFSMGDMSNRPYYAISLKGYEKNLGKHPSEDDFLKELSNIIKAMTERENDQDTLAIGGWLDKEGNVILDLTELFPTGHYSEEAMIHVGQIREQQAIFNLETMTEIPVPVSFHS